MKSSWRASRKKEGSSVERIRFAVVVRESFLWWWLALEIDIRGRHLVYIMWMV